MPMKNKNTIRLNSLFIVYTVYFAKVRKKTKDQGTNPIFVPLENAFQYGWHAAYVEVHEA